MDTLERKKKEVRFASKIIMLIFNDTEEKAVEKALAALAGMTPLEAIQPPQSLPHTVFFWDCKSDCTNAGY